MSSLPKFKSINLVVGGKDVTLKVEDAKMLRDILNDIFPEPKTLDPYGYGDHTVDNNKYPAIYTKDNTGEDSPYWVGPLTVSSSSDKPITGIKY